MRHTLLAALFLFAAACGTVVDETEVVVTVEPASSAPVEVSIFDHQMGYSRDWAHKTMAATSAAKPYTTSYSTTRTAMVTGPKRAPKLEMSLAVPRLSDDGYYLFAVELPSESETEGKASFVEYGSYFPEQGAPMIPIRYRSESTTKGWRVFLTVPLDEAATGKSE